MQNSCETCIYGNKLFIKSQVLCLKHGIVPSEYECKKYKHDLTTKEVRKKRSPLLNVNVKPTI